MGQHTTRVSPRLPSAVAAATAALALGALAAAWLTSARWPDGSALVLTMGLLVAIVSAFQFPLHIARQTKVYVTSVPYYLLAVLVLPPLAATAAGLGALMGELSVRQARGNTTSFVVTQVGRRTLIVLFGAVLAERVGTMGMHVLALTVAVVVLEVGDIVSCPLSLVPLSGQSPLQIIVTVARAAYLIEAVQYLLGMLGALAAEQQLWAVVLLAPSTVLVYLAFQAMLRADEARKDADAARRAVEEAVRVRDNFLIAASHDLRTPLTNILGRLAIVQARLDSSRPLPNEWLCGHTHSLDASARRLADTIEEITDAAHLQMGQPVMLRREPVDVGVLVQAVLEARLWGEAPLLRVDVRPSVVVEGDRARLERVVQNLVENAVKYTREGRPVHITVCVEGNWAVLVVRDEGVGIPAAEVSSIFTPFYRASTAMGTSGTGIGLAGVKTIIEQHGGEISIETAVDHGTEVTVRLPLVDPNQKDLHDRTRGLTDVLAPSH